MKLNELLNEAQGGGQIVNVLYADYPSIPQLEEDDAKKAIMQALSTLGAGAKVVKKEFAHFVIHAPNADDSKVAAFKKKFNEIRSEDQDYPLNWEVEAEEATEDKLKQHAAHRAAEVEAAKKQKAAEKDAVPMKEREWVFVDGTGEHYGMGDDDVLFYSDITEFPFDSDDRKKLKTSKVGDETEMYDDMNGSSATLKRVK